MKLKKNKKKWVAVASALAAVAVMVGTFAWFTSQDSATNHFEGEIAGNDVEVVESFTPPTDWKPGQDVNKDVAILNSGNYDSMIRVSFEEIITKLNDASAKLSSDATLLNGKTEKDVYLYPLNSKAMETGEWTESKITPEKTFTVTGGDYEGTYTLKAKEQKVTTDAGTTYKYVSYWDNGTSQYYAKVGAYSRNNDTNEITPSTAEFKYVDLASTSTPADWTNPLYNPTILIDKDGNATVDADSDSKIKLHFVNLSEKPEMNKWYFNKADACFYYVAIVAPQTQTAQLLDSVQLDESADIDYSKLQFDLIVNAKAIQAAKEAVNSTDWVNSTNTELSTALEGLY